ncbi:MAG TPA: sigma 54-interacting transcriptional regulator [Kofleriaceae bacterium]|nr:sigma 54-interacting transcriptional regulator [Kofleriaceae bacterium]
MSAQDEHDDDEGLSQTITVVGKDATRDAVPGYLQVVVIGNGTFATHPVPDGAALTIGRSNRCEIPVDDESISRRHAILHIGETVTIEDLGSVNGTVVRGNRLNAGRPTAIAVGELVGLGKISIILQRRSRPERARRLCMHDYFETRLEEECARVKRSGAAFALLRVHSDRRAPASFIEEVLGELLRESDILGKYGPNEYEALLPDTPAAKAEEAVRRIAGKLLERGLECRIFYVCCPRDGRSAYELSAKLQAQATHEKATTMGAEVVVADAQMQSLYRLIDQVAASSIGVLLLGETGVGKEVLARAVHRASPRAAGPFVEINCAALTDTLLESELFGHEKGAFTNAVMAKPGLLEAAHGGTVLLDEIGDMPLSTQVKLLRVIEDAQVRRVGGLKSRAIDVRFVAATNCDVEAQVARGTFRRDLFFRLNGVTIVIPPLRERLADLEPLVQAFIHRAKPPGVVPPPVLAPETLALLKAYAWPGNVRELKNVIERAVFLCGGGTIRPEHLPREILSSGRPAAPAPQVVRLVRHGGDTRPLHDDLPTTEDLVARPRRRGAEEQQWIMQALERTGGNQTLAARLLGISRRTLVNRLNEYKEVYRPRKDRKPSRDE